MIPCHRAQSISETGGILCPPAHPGEWLFDWIRASPPDIEIRRNQLFKPFTWLPGSPSYDGGAVANTRRRGFSARNIAELKQSVKAVLAGTADPPPGRRNPVMVKNLFELKSAFRVLLEGNVLENVWGGFSQAGSAILLTPRSQGGQCPACLVTDVTIRYNLIHKAGQGFGSSHRW